MSTYETFLRSKIYRPRECGITVPALNAKLFPFQHDIVRWSLRKGRAAIFADCGLGKTLMQLEWSKRVSDHSKGKVLILAPLAVAQQTIREGQKFDIEVGYSRHQSESSEGITITNYEMLEHFNPSDFAGIVLDESSILKAYDGKTRTRIIEAFNRTPFRLACTATPAPNDSMELGNHAEFLGVMTRTEMLATFFVHDGGETQAWRLKGHAEAEFWKWVCSWAVMVRKPSDLGYEDGDFVLPPLEMNHRIVPVSLDEAHNAGMLFAKDARTLQEQRETRRASVARRVSECADLVNRTSESWIVWCELNDESKELAKAIPDAIEIKGADSHEIKEQRMLDFSEGRARVLVTKPSIAGFGMNWQHCHNIAFVGVSHSYEQTYQAIRRCWRFGQQEKVSCTIVSAETEGAIVTNLQRKERQAQHMADEMTEHMRDIQREEIKGTVRSEAEYARQVERGNDWELRRGDVVDITKELPDDSIHYSVFSPPFSSLYTYSNSERDMGNCRNWQEFLTHFRFLIPELLRVTKPGRLLSFHCMNLPTSKVRDGVIGLEDFRGLLIREFKEAGWIYHSEVCIWKDPVTAMQRTKALGLLYKQLKKDSAMSRQGIADYLVTMRKPGDNPERVTKSPEDFPCSLWQNYASPVWMDINPSETLQFQAAREEKDEKHICPLQLEVIRRAIKLWTNPNDLVFDPFAGIASTGHVAIEQGRRFIGAELKESYWQAGVNNLRHAQKQSGGLFAAIEDSQLEEACA